MKLLTREHEDHGVKIQSVGADKAYHCGEFVKGLREREIRPHIACRSDREVEGLDGRTTRHESYQSSQRKRKLVEQPLGFSPRRIAGG